MKRVFGYVRGSTKEQADTLSVQEAEILRHYEYRYKRDGYEYAGTYTDAGVSGSTPLAERPEGLRLVACVEEGDVIVVTKLDRLFRNFRDLADRMEWAKKRGVSLVLLDLNVDTGTPVGQMLASIVGAVAQFERDRMRERLAETIRLRKAQGRPVARNAPYGYRLSGPRGNRHFVRSNHQRKWGKVFVELIDGRGMSVRQVWLYLLENRMFGADNKEFKPTQIRKWYLGELALSRAEAEAERKKGGADALEETGND